MASVFGHTLAAYTISRLSSDNIYNKKVVLLGIVSSILPDVDVLAFNYGIDYESMLGHRGLTHSIFFALVWAFVLILLFHRKNVLSSKRYLFVFYALCVFSHAVLDALTTGGAGVAFFAPFHGARYFLPWRVIEVSPIGADNFFSDWGVAVLWSELKYIGIPCVLLITLSVFNKSKKKNEHLQNL